MKESGNGSRAVTAASSTVASRTASKDQESWDHIQDAGLRKKVQNRIAQRLYRERIKKRIEALEQFQDASTSAKADLTLSDTSPLVPSNSNRPRRKEGHSVTSPTSTRSASCHSCCLQAQYSCSGPPASAPPPEEEGNITSPCPSLPEQTPTIMTPPVDPALPFETFMQANEYTVYDDYSDSSIWELGEAIHIGNNAAGFRKGLDFEDSPSLEQACCGFSEPMLALGRSKTVPQPSLLDDSQDGKTALHIAAENGQQSTVELLLSLRPEILAQDQMGRTALHLAVHNKHEGVIMELLRNPKNLEIRDRGGQTALHAAVATGQERAVALLLAAGANAEAKDSAQRTALHLAAFKGSNKILQLLLDSGADINAKTR